MATALTFDEFSPQDPTAPLNFDEFAPSTRTTNAPKGGTPYQVSPEQFAMMPGHGTLEQASAVAQSNLLPDNLGSSAMNFGLGMANMALHPIDTAKNLVKTGVGEGEKLLGTQRQNEVPYADAINQHYAQYVQPGGLEKAWQADPVGTAADLSMLAMPLEGAARVPGVVGNVASKVALGARALDPVGSTINAAKNLGKTGANAVAETLGSPVGSGAGGEAIRQAGAAGYGLTTGNPDAYKAFQANAIGGADPKAVVAQAKDAVQNMRAARSQAYTDNMATIGKDPTVLDFKPIDSALAGVNNIKTFKGQELSPSTTDIRNQLNSTIDQWKSLDPAEYHTAAGFDALKQKLGDILGATPLGTPQHTVAQQVYNSVKNQIVQQAPQYAATMKHYSDASDLIHQMESTLSLNGKATIDTQLRKLQSVMRNNVNTNYGARTDLANQLAQNGAPNIMPALAGQALSSWAPRGLAGITTGTGLQTALQLGASALHPMAGFAMLAHFPKPVGQAAVAAGAGAGILSHLPLNPAARFGYQARNAPPQY